MSRAHLRALLSPLSLVILLEVCAGRAAARESCDSDRCHAKMLKGENVHAIASNCEGCHESQATPHPQKGKQTFKLSQEPPDLCTSCHSGVTEGRHLHPPVQQGMCTACHDPHSASEPKLLTKAAGELCAVCHADQAGAKFPHGPVSAGQCAACHNPHASSLEKLLVKEGPELCGGCHVDMQEVTKKKHVHPALSGGCTSCHDPHGAAFPKLLSQQGQQLCFLCHGDVAAKVNDSAVGHPAVMMGDGCVSCHSPHASDNEKMLLEPVRDTCLSCHDAVSSKSLKVLHGPDNDGKCTLCHEPHGSAHEHLLVRPFPTEVYVPYSDTEYALCLGCHKRDLLAHPETSFATNFRDGERNLHYLHVNDKQKGRSCKLCHTVHGSDNAKLIADTVPFGKWNLPLKFAKTETGGSCAPGCHKPQRYDRKNPGGKPPAAAKQAADP